MNTKLIPCRVTVYQPGSSISIKYTGMFHSTVDALKDAMQRFNCTSVVATPITSKEVKA